MNPMILVGGAAALLLLSGGKKKSSKTSGSRGEPPPMGGSGSGPGGLNKSHLLRAGVQGSAKNWKPWEYCEPPSGSPKNTYAAYNESGECVVFWRPDSWDVAIATMKQALDRLPAHEAEALCEKGSCVPDPHAADPVLSCDWEENPALEAFVSNVVMEMFPQIERHMLPPKEGASYFVKTVYDFTFGTFLYEFCGYRPVI